MGGPSWAEGYLERNERSLARLRRTVDGLTDEQAAQAVTAEWTVGATLAHLAWWDRYLVARWRSIAAGQDVPEQPGYMLDAINDATTPLYLAVTPAVAIAEVIAAAEAANARVAGLTEEQVACAIEAGRPDLLDRSNHRTLHLDEIDRVLAS